MRLRTYLGRLTIPNAGTDSNVLSSGRLLSLAESYIFYNPAAFTGTISVRVGQKADTPFASHRPLDNNGSAVTLTANRVQRHSVNGFESISIQSGSAEGGQRDVEVYVVTDGEGD